MRFLAPLANRRSPAPNRFNARAASGRRAEAMQKQNLSLAVPLDVSDERSRVIRLYELRRKRIDLRADLRSVEAEIERLETKKPGIQAEETITP